jgi:hypothetical protein
VTSTVVVTVTVDVLELVEELVVEVLVVTGTGHGVGHVSATDCPTPSSSTATHRRGDVGRVVRVADAHGSQVSVPTAAFEDEQTVAAVGVVPVVTGWPQSPAPRGRRPGVAMKIRHAKSKVGMCFVTVTKSPCTA